MNRNTSIIGLAISFCLLTGAALAQPASSSVTPAGNGLSSGNANLAVATVKLGSGYRASKVIGAAVYNAQNQQVGTIDDIVLDASNQAILAVISVGGFIGIGSKLIAVDYKNLHRQPDKVILPDASKDALNRMPSFTYNG